MSSDRAGVRDEKPTDKFAQSDQALPSGRGLAPEYISDVDAEDIVEDAAEDSFPASDPPAYTTGTREGDPGHGV
ncbi:MAG: hypothetical protein QOJ59_4349 [Thermomicrobiales bacterium]|jgi:hypothetical protein|nr:hypothetical protein [Thermomicrobiales bacterium]